MLDWATPRPNEAGGRPDESVTVRQGCIAMAGGLLPEQLSLSVGPLRIGERSLAVGDVAIRRRHLSSILLDPQGAPTARYLPDRAAFEGFTGGFVRLGFEHTTSSEIRSMLIGCRTRAEAAAVATALGEWGHCSVDGL